MVVFKKMDKIDLKVIDCKLEIQRELEAIQMENSKPCPGNLITKVIAHIPKRDLKGRVIGSYSIAKIFKLSDESKPKFLTEHSMCLDTDAIIYITNQAVICPSDPSFEVVHEQYIISIIKQAALEEGFGFFTQGLSDE